MAYGFVYVLVNWAMPGFVKVGHTERPPHVRVEELSKSTSVPVEFEVFAYVEVRDSLAVEQLAHRHLAQRRVNPAREFFSVSPLLAWGMVQHAANELDGILIAAESWRVADARDDLAREQEEQSANFMLNLRQEAMTYTEHDFSYERIAVWEEGARKYAAEQAACAGENVVSIGQARAA